MLKELGPGLRFMVVFTILTGLVYPVVMTGIAELIFPKQARGSLVSVNGKIVGSSLIGQPFTKPEYDAPYMPTWPLLPGRDAAHSTVSKPSACSCRNGYHSPSEV